MEKMILEHINIEDIPSKWAQFLKNAISSSYRITIEPEPEPRPDPPREYHVRKSWADMPMFGMWKDRDDMDDPIEYVKQIRKSRF